MTDWFNSKHFNIVSIPLCKLNMGDTHNLHQVDVDVEDESFSLLYVFAWKLWSVAAIVWVALLPAASTFIMYIVPALSLHSLLEESSQPDISSVYPPMMLVR